MAKEYILKDYENIFFNDVDLERVFFNDILVWEKWKYVTDKNIHVEKYSKSKDWNKYYTFTTGDIMFDKTIKNPSGYFLASAKDCGENSKNGGYVEFIYTDDTRSKPVEPIYHNYSGSMQYKEIKKEFNITDNKPIKGYKLTGEVASFSGGVNLILDIQKYYSK